MMTAHEKQDRSHSYAVLLITTQSLIATLVIIPFDQDSLPCRLNRPDVRSTSKLLKRPSDPIDSSHTAV